MGACINYLRAEAAAVRWLNNKTKTVALQQAPQLTSEGEAGEREGVGVMG